MESEFLTVDEAARELRICSQLAYALVRDGKLPHLKLGRRIVILRAGIAAMRESALAGYRAA